MIGNSCCFHGLNYALFHDMTQQDSTNDHGCKFLFFPCHHLKRVPSDVVTVEENDKNDELYVNDTKNQRNNAINVINSILEKFNFFLAYQSRCKCQLVAISSTKECIEENTISCSGGNIHALIRIDFKLYFVWTKF